MSILSEAWRRAHGGDARLSQALGAPVVSLRERPPLLPWLLCGLLVALVAGLGVYIWLDQTRPPPAPVPTAAAAMPGGNKAGGAVSQHHVATPGSVQPKATRPAGRVASPAVERPIAAAAPAASSSVTAGIAAEKAGHEAPAHDAAAAVKASAPPHSAARQAPAASPSEPIELNAAPDAIRTAFPSLDVVVHVWNADPASRFIVIGAQQYHAGDEIAPGVRLRKITRNGEIVGFRGYRLILH